ncbi:MAG: nucleotidyltransferase domain-containing protein [Patescibacteria group bacterium]|jgi:predicted nucleotidyltransferase
MAKKRILPKAISPYVTAYLTVLKEQRKLPITAAYVFGSWSKGTQHEDSDIDMCIISPKLTGWMRRVDKLSPVPYSDLFIIEPHGFTPKEFDPKTDPLAYEIVKYGIRVI